MPIRPLHLSFREFLHDNQKRGKSPFWVNEKETHMRLANKCLQLLSSPKGLRQNMCNLTSPRTLRSKIKNQILGKALSLEVRYTCRYWAHYLEQNGDRIYDGCPVHAFLRKYFLYWLEAMSLMGEASASIRMINSLQLLTHVSYFKNFYIGSYSYSSPRPMKMPQYLVFFMMKSTSSWGINQY